MQGLLAGEAIFVGKGRHDGLGAIEAGHEVVHGLLDTFFVGHDTWSVGLVAHLVQGLAQLVGAGRGAHAAAYALELLDDFFGLHAAHQAADALQVAVASVPDFHIAYDAVLHRHDHVGAARASGLVMIGHNVGLLRG